MQLFNNFDLLFLAANLTGFFGSDCLLIMIYCFQLFSWSDEDYCKPPWVVPMH